MARSGRLSNAFVVSVTTIIASALVVYPVLGAIDWQLEDSSDTRVVVYNATVPDAERLQQRAVDLVLEHRKVVDVTQVGASPIEGLAAWPDTRPDVVFLVDAYGVYLDDLPDGSEFDSRLLTDPLGDQVAADLADWIDRGTFVYGEFNILHAPTPAEVSEQFQALFRVDATGWVGRWFEDLSDVGPSIRILGDGEWPNGEGLILVSGPVGDRDRSPALIVLRDDDLSGGPPRLSGVTLDGSDIDGVPVTDWFAVIEPDDMTEVALWLELPVSSSAAESLAAAGIPSRLPLLVADERSAYFAANVSRTSAQFPMRRISGALALLRALPQSNDAALFYRATAPTLDWILDSR